MTVPELQKNPVSYTHLDVYKRQAGSEEGWWIAFMRNYRRLNDVTKKYCYPLPRVDDTPVSYTHLFIDSSDKE